MMNEQSECSKVVWVVSSELYGSTIAEKLKFALLFIHYFIFLKIVCKLKKYRLSKF